MWLFKKFILGLFIFTLGCSCAFAQNNYSIPSIELYNAGVVFQRNEQFAQAEQKYAQVLKLQPNFQEAKNNLESLYKNWANKYLKASDYNNAIKMYKKTLAIDSNDFDTMQLLAQTYLQNNEFDKAIQIYNKILVKNPNDKISIQNLKYANSKIEDSILKESLNGLEHVSISPAPKALYRLIKSKNGVSAATANKTRVILDLIWSEPSGRIMLAELMSAKIPINITQGNFDANATSTNKKNTLYLYGLIPVFSYNSSTLEVNIPFTYIENINDRNLSNYQRIYSLHVFLHEFCHAYRAINNPSSFNSIEEELGASMIGYNIAYKILTGRYMTQEQTEIYSLACFEALMKDSHRDLPLYSGFYKEFKSYGIVLPYPNEYSNLRVIYNKLLSEGKIYPVASFQRTKN